MLKSKQNVEREFLAHLNEFQIARLNFARNLPYKVVFTDSDRSLIDRKRSTSIEMVQSKIFQAEKHSSYK